MPPRDSTLHYKVTEARSASLAPFVFNFLAEIYTDRTRVLASACINFMGGVFDGARNLCDGGGVRNLYTSASYVQFPDLERSSSIDDISFWWGLAGIVHRHFDGNCLNNKSALQKIRVHCRHTRLHCRQRSQPSVTYIPTALQYRALFQFQGWNGSLTK